MHLYSFEEISDIGFGEETPSLVSLPDTHDVQHIPCSCSLRKLRFIPTATQGCICNRSTHTSHSIVVFILLKGRIDTLTASHYCFSLTSLTVSKNFTEILIPEHLTSKGQGILFLMSAYHTIHRSLIEVLQI